jgi:ATP-dependent DNA helicase RecG
MKFRENETVELKKSTSERKEAVISIVSILNKHSQGELYFGIKNDGTVAGQEVTEKTIRQISHYIAENIEPKIYPDINHIQVKGIDCIHVKFSGSEKPYYAFGRAYIRIGDEDRQLSAKEIENIILNKHKNQLRWDNRICENAGLQDISRDKLEKFLETAGLKFTSVKNSLTKLGLTQNGNILNSAVILFAEKPEEFFPNAKLRCAVFGTTRTAYIIDRQEFSGDLFYLIEMAEEYILKNIHIGMKLDGLYRIDVPEISRPAFREAVINAFCHRDFNEYDSVNIAIFKDRLEIRNPGGLFGGLTIEQIKKEPISKRRNELIAEMFHRVHFVEKWGRGIDLIRTEEPTVDFKEIADTFITTLSRKHYDAETAETGKKNSQ